MFSWLLGFKRGFKQAHLDRIIDTLLSQSDLGTLEDRQFCLSEKEMSRLSRATREALLAEPALLELPRFEGETVLVGDLHGQFQDLTAIFEAVGRPGPQRQYIFLGDYVDRGECGLEIVACLFALKLRYPDRVYLLRGNHECTEISVMFGFCSECQRRSTLAVWEVVMQAFDALPLAALLQQKVLCVHGGISPQLTSLSAINEIPRPTDVNPSGAGLLVDLLWADPCLHTTGWCHSPRGVSYCFGLGAAREFMAATGVRSIVRAHMMQADGFEVLGNHEVITVFSAVNYRGSGNTGAVLLLDADRNMHFRTFLPPEPQQASPASVLLPDGLAADGQEQAALGSSSDESTVEQRGGAAQALPSPPYCTALAAGSGAAGPGPQLTSSVEIVALEEVVEDSLAVHHQLPLPPVADSGSSPHGVLGKGAAEWRYALPASSVGGGAA